MNEILLDQLPPLADVQRFMDELTIMQSQVRGGGHEDEGEGEGEEE